MCIDLYSKYIWCNSFRDEHFLESTFISQKLLEKLPIYYLLSYTVNTYVCVCPIFQREPFFTFQIRFVPTLSTPTSVLKRLYFRSKGRKSELRCHRVYLRQRHESQWRRPPRGLERAGILPGPMQKSQKHVARADRSRRSFPDWLRPSQSQRRGGEIRGLPLPGRV